VPSLELDRGKHAKRRVTALAVMEDLEVFEDRVGQLDAGAPGAAVKELDLHPTPERLDHGVVVATPDRAH